MCSNHPMQLRELTAAANAVAATRSRKQKIATLAACLARMDPEEIQTGASYLMGLLPGGPVGLGPAAVSGLGGVEAASTSVLELNEVQGAVDKLREVSGQGATRRRQHLLAALLRRAVGEEQDFLRRLLLGELRQGALEGLLIEAIALAADIPTAAIGRAVMLAGNAAAVARAALTEGAAGGAAAGSATCTSGRAIRPGASSC